MLTKNLAAEWAERRVRVNAEGPGPIRTPMTLPLFEADPAMSARWDARPRSGESAILRTSWGCSCTSPATPRRG
jgi:NAD(P)-dependent dehydrogenase (short-subunit alcohol dehydrogenase family)